MRCLFAGVALMLVVSCLCRISNLLVCGLELHGVPWGVRRACAPGVPCGAMWRLVWLLSCGAGTWMRHLTFCTGPAGRTTSLLELKGSAGFGRF